MPSFFGYVMFPAKDRCHPIDALAGDVGVAREAMDHDVRRTLTEDSKDRVPRVADVNDEREAGVARELDVRSKRPLLVLGG
jgi:hypothetical protein